MSFPQAWNLLARKMIVWGRDFVLLLPNLGLAILALIAFWLLARGLRSLSLRLLRRVSHSEQVSWLLSQTLYLAVVVVGASVALGILGLQKTVASLLAGAGIVGLALGFAFQDIAANLMAGMYLSIQRPFRRGHLIKTQDYFGVVKEVTLRWTEIISQQGQMVLIPNKQVFENPIMNYSQLGRRRIDLTVGVSYGDDLEKVRRIAMQAVEGVTGRLPDREIELFYEEFGESSIDFSIRFWIEFKRQTDYLLARSEAILRIKEAFDANGITIPFPIRTLDFVAKGGETLSEILEEVGVGTGAPAGRRPVR
ncbi:MAG TPA: mechanosensitive ion channel family protein [Thermoanaerobaculia bacterium]